jgi:3-oxoacyl-[acyl-carrier protein] reductase
LEILDFGSTYFEVSGPRGMLKPMAPAIHGKVSLVTGASRGVGAAVAIKLATLGSDLILNFRNKGSRAEEVAQKVAACGSVALLAQADLTIEPEVAAMMKSVRERFQSLDILVLNASGGLEKEKPQDYAMTLNLTAQMRTARLASELMKPGGRIVFVTSHWAHFYSEKPVMPEYEAVAQSKYAGEQALRGYIPDLRARGISLVVVSGDAIEGTITPRLLERRNRGLANQIAERDNRIHTLPTVDDFAEAIVKAAIDDALPSGHTSFVGATEY